MSISHVIPRIKTIIKHITLESNQVAHYHYIAIVFKYLNIEEICETSTDINIQKKKKIHITFLFLIYSLYIDASLFHNVNG